jgi:hypothetical protein
MIRGGRVPTVVMPVDVVPVTVNFPGDSPGFVLPFGSTGRDGDFGLSGRISRISVPIALESRTLGEFSRIFPDEIALRVLSLREI